jgi:choline dehydrogenase-like flavoprotein
MGIGGGSCMMIMIHIRFCIIDFLTLPSRVSRTSDCCSPVSEARTWILSHACIMHKCQQIS